MKPLEIIVYIFPPLLVLADDTLMVKVKLVTSHSSFASLTIFIGNHDWGQTDAPAWAVQGQARLKISFPSVFDQRLTSRGKWGSRLLRAYTPLRDALTFEGRFSLVLVVLLTFF